MKDYLKFGLAAGAGYLGMSLLSPNIGWSSGPPNLNATNPFLPPSKSKPKHISKPNTNPPDIVLPNENNPHWLDVTPGIFPGWAEPTLSPPLQIATAEPGVTSTLQLLGNPILWVGIAGIIGLYLITQR